MESDVPCVNGTCLDLFMAQDIYRLEEPNAEESKDSHQGQLVHHHATFTVHTSRHKMTAYESNVLEE